MCITVCKACFFKPECLLASHFYTVASTGLPLLVTFILADSHGLQNSYLRVLSVKGPGFLALCSAL